MDLNRLRFDPFALAVGALGLLTVAFLATRNGAAVVMCALCVAGLLAARAAGFDNLALVPVAAGVIAILWMIWIDPPTGGPRRISAIAHFGGGALVGWALARYLRARVAWPLWGAAAIAAVFGLTVVWELGELIGDRLLTTALVPDAQDSALDIFFGTLGGSLIVVLTGALAARARR